MLAQERSQARPSRDNNIVQSSVAIIEHIMLQCKQDANHLYSLHFIASFVKRIEGF